MDTASGSSLAFVYLRCATSSVSYLENSDDFSHFESFFESLIINLVTVNPRGLGK